MSENEPVAESRRIFWDRVLAENEEGKDPTVQAQVFAMTYATWTLAKETGLECEVSKEAMILSSCLITVVVTDCMAASGIKKAPIILPNFDMDPRVAARAWRTNKGEMVISINGNSLLESARELEGHGKEERYNLRTTSQVVFQVAHEMGHVRQREVLASNEDTTNSNDLPSDADEIALLWHKINYATHPLEVNANAFATRYVRKKQDDAKVAPLWKDLDFSETLVRLWGNICSYGKLKAKVKLEALRQLRDRIHPDQLLRYMSMLETIQQQIDAWDTKSEQFIDRFAR